VISDPDTARQISELALKIRRRLDGSVAHVLATCSPDEFTAYRKAVGKVTGELLTEILNPLYAAHPQLKRPDLR
jgi:hypothetical protein